MMFRFIKIMSLFNVDKIKMGDRDHPFKNISYYQDSIYRPCSLYSS